jgi:hypothetical protein
MVAVEPEPMAQLAEAHKHMTAEHIRNHACDMAGIIRSQEELILTLLGLVASLEERLAREQDGRRTLAMVIRKISALWTSHRRAEARELLKTSAVECRNLVDIDERPRFDRSLFQPVAEAWPDWLNPEGKS